MCDFFGSIYSHKRSIKVITKPKFSGCLINESHQNLFVIFRYGRWVTRRIAVATIAAIWMLAGFVSFVPISFSLHRPEQPLVFEDKDGKEFPTCALDLTPTYAVVSSCISFYVPCIVMIGIYCRYVREFSQKIDKSKFHLIHIRTFLSRQTLLLRSKAREKY